MEGVLLICFASAVADVDDLGAHLLACVWEANNGTSIKDASTRFDITDDLVQQDTQGTSMPGIVMLIQHQGGRTSTRMHRSETGGHLHHDMSHVPVPTGRAGARKVPSKAGIGTG
jgi:hypothetical protein